jgi:hypothetical protein
MSFIAQVRVAEPWTVWNILGVILLVSVLVAAIYAATRRG